MTWIRAGSFGSADVERPPGAGIAGYCLVKVPGAGHHGMLHLAHATSGCQSMVSLSR